MIPSSEQLSPAAAPASQASPDQAAPSRPAAGPPGDRQAHPSESAGAGGLDAAAAPDMQPDMQPDTQPTGSADVQSAMQAVSRVVCTAAVSPGSQAGSQQHRPLTGPHGLLQPSEGLPRAAPSPDQPCTSSPGAQAVETHSQGRCGSLLQPSADGAELLGAGGPCSFHLNLDLGDTQPPEAELQHQSLNLSLSQRQPAALPSQPQSPSQPSMPTWLGGRTSHILLTQPTQASLPGSSPPALAPEPAPGAPAGAPSLSPTPSLPSAAGHRQPSPQPQSTARLPTRQPHSGRPQPRLQGRAAAAAASSMLVEDSQDAPGTGPDVHEGPALSPSSPSACVADSPPGPSCRMAMPMHDQSLPQPGLTPAAANRQPGPMRKGHDSRHPHAHKGHAEPPRSPTHSPYAPQPADRAKRRHARAAPQQPLRTKTCGPI